MSMTSVSSKNSAIARVSCDFEGKAWFPGCVLVVDLWNRCAHARVSAGGTASSASPAMIMARIREDTIGFGTASAGDGTT